MLLQSSLFVIPKLSDVDWKTFIAGLKRNQTPIIFTGLSLIAFIIGFIVTLKMEAKADTREKFRILKESRLTDVALYAISIYISVIPFSGSRERIYVKLYGTKGSSKEFCLQNADEYIFQRGQVLTFIISSKEFLGRITHMNIRTPVIDLTYFGTMISL